MNILIIVLAKKSIIIIIIINLSMKQRKMRLYTNRHKLRLSEPIHSEHQKNTRKKSCSPIAENNNYSCYSHQSLTKIAEQWNKTHHQTIGGNNPKKSQKKKLN